MPARALPPVTEDLLRRLDGAATDFTLRWLEGVAGRAGNPRGLRIERFGDAIAPASRAEPDLDFMNRVMRLFPRDAGRLEDILAFYRGLGVRPWFELAPGDGFERLASALTAGGAAQIGFHSVLYGLPAPETLPNPAADARVEEVGPGNAFEAFVDTLLEGLELPAKALDEARRDHAPWASVEPWRCYLARIDGRAAAAAVLAVVDGVGLLAAAATRPAFRGRGCQTALIHRRVADAAAAGCELVTANAEFASSSHRNLQRAGLREAFTKAVWRVGEGT